MRTYVAGAHYTRSGRLCPVDFASIWPPLRRQAAGDPQLERGQPDVHGLAHHSSHNPFRAFRGRRRRVQNRVVVLTRDSGPPPGRVTRAARLVWIAAGWLFVAVGIIGIVVPGLPTTGPMLLALACFARGSERLHRWLLNHSVFGPPIHRWHAHRTIWIRDKIVAITMMLGSLAYVVWLSPPMSFRWPSLRTITTTRSSNTS